MNHLLLLHGALGHPTQFSAYLPYLSRHFQVHTLCFEGHGNSPIPEEGLSVERYIRQLHEYCEEQQLEQVHILGYSMGGYVALCYALEQPQRVRSLLTLATKLDWSETGASRESRLLDPAIITEKVPRYAAQLADLHGTEQWKALLPAIGNMMISLGRKPLLGADQYTSIQARVQLMVGDQDKMVGISETVTAAQHIPGARIAVLPQTSHPLEKVRLSLLQDLMSDFWELNGFTLRSVEKE